MTDLKQKEEEIATILQSEQMLHVLEQSHLGAAASLQKQLEEWKGRRFLRPDINPEKLTLIMMDFMHDFAYLSGVLEYLLSKERARLAIGLEPSRIQEMTEKLKSVEAQLEKRKRGLDWVDNLIEHSPKTEENPS